MTRRAPSSTRRLLALLLVVAVAWAAAYLTRNEGVVRGREALAEAFAQRRSGVHVEIEAPVKRLLADDTDGSPHQRFLLDLGDGFTVLVAHNVALAPRVPVEPGDLVEIRGQYEYNDKGGVIHWTHHDPDRRRPGGWIHHRGRTYE